MNTEKWKEIAEDYKKAMRFLEGWGVLPEEESHVRDSTEGNYYLYKAYRAAKKEKEKDHLLYARMLMYFEKNFCSYQDCFSKVKYAKEAVAEYQLAAEQPGEKPTRKEVSFAKHEYEFNKYLTECFSDDEEQYNKAIKLIDGYEEINDFWFHDSFVKHFEYDEKKALLTLDYCGTQITFEFTGIYDINVSTDPETDYVPDMYCYKDFFTPERKHFDIGLLRIYCEKIRVIKKEKIK